MGVRARAGRARHDAAGNAALMAASRPLVELRGVGKSYHEGDSERVVLAEVDETIARGEVVALVGPSGSGKSTLLNLIAGIDHPSRGVIVLDGRALGEWSERERALYRRGAVGFVFQFFNLLPTLTVEENVRLPLELAGMAGPGARERVRAMLGAVGLADRAKAFPDRLSGGEQQRVAVARALVHGPQLVLADEPTGNLDIEAARHVLGLLRGLAANAAATVVLATHSMEAAELADRVLLLRAGRLVEARRRMPR